jgi:YD repeat-containing protein
MTCTDGNKSKGDGMGSANVLRSIGKGIFRVATEFHETATLGRLLEPLVVSGTRRLGKRRVHSRRAVLGAVASLWAAIASAQSHTIYVQPLFLYEFYNVQCCAYGGTTPPATWGTLSAAWTWSQAAINGTSEGTTATAMDLIVPSGAIVQDGNPTVYDFSVQVCSSGNCVTHPNIGYIQSGYACPKNAGAGDYNYSPPNQLIACAITIPDVQPSTDHCKTCFGNPIYAATGQKLQIETDYSGPSGLDFTRTYRSNNGFFASVLTQAFVNNSLPAGTTSTQCYPAQWTFSNASGSFCFPYISTYPYVNNGAPQYQLQTDDGRSIEFSGPNTAVTAAADINERVTQLTVNGATEWQVMREDDTTEIYNAAGLLIQKTLRGGRTLTYTYSTASTPTSVAPQAGLLIIESDAFGHSLSWTYNSSGQMATMTDPSGMPYQYSYDGNGNLTGVSYPDGTSKTYWYNESANTGGANLPNALTGITDQNGVRYATFQYNSAGLAVNTQHAGGVESYTFTYGRVNYSAAVVDPLGTTRSYTFSPDGLSYDNDTGQTQPAASGTGTVTQAETYDANGNPKSVTDYNGNVTQYVYDLTRNLETSRTEAYGTAQARTISTTWNATWRQPLLITEPNRTTAFTYDNLGNVLTKTITDTTVTPNVTRVWTYTYDGYGRMLTAKLPRTDVNSTTTYTYYTCTTGYQCGRIQTITDAVGHMTTFNTYNAHGQPLTITDPNGVVTTMTYDLCQRILSRQIGTETTGYSYYPTGLLKQVTLPDSTTLVYTYDAAHRLTTITDGLGNHINYTLDAMGNRTAENAYDPSGNPLCQCDVRHLEPSI